MKKKHTQLNTLILSSILLATTVSATEINTFATDFKSEDLSDWSQESYAQFHILDNALTTTHNGRANIYVKDFLVNSNYDISMTIPSDGTNKQNSKPILFNYKDDDSEFYSLSLKTGTYGMIYLSKRESIYGAATILYSSPRNINVDASVSHDLKIEVLSGNMNIYLDNILMAEVPVYGFESTGNKVGVHSFDGSTAKSIDNFIVNNHVEFETTFEKSFPQTFELISGVWSQGTESNFGVEQNINFLQP